MVFSDYETHLKYVSIFKFTESAMFYFGPLVLQLVCYIVIGRRLFVGVDKLHRNFNVRCTPDRRQRTHEAIRARKGVVKMLIASVVIYFLSYSPHQVRWLEFFVKQMCHLVVAKKGQGIYIKIQKNKMSCLLVD